MTFVRFREQLLSFKSRRDSIQLHTNGMVLLQTRAEIKQMIRSYLLRRTAIYVCAEEAKKSWVVFCLHKICFYERNDAMFSMRRLHAYVVECFLFFDVSLLSRRLQMVFVASAIRMWIACCCFLFQNDQFFCV